LVIITDAPAGGDRILLLASSKGSMSIIIEELTNASFFDTRAQPNILYVNVTEVVHREWLEPGSGAKDFDEIFRKLFDELFLGRSTSPSQSTSLRSSTRSEPYSTSC
ncbi:hypothetical protein TSAR_014035, partial [Trichomalopsis sarcophagae]